MYIYIPNGVFLRPSFNNNTDRVCQHIGYKRSPKNPKAWSLADLESSCWWEGANPIHGGWASPVGLMGRSPHPHLPLMVIGLVGGNPENPERTYYKRILRVDFFLKIVVKKSPQLDLCEDHPIVGKRCSNVCCRGGVIFMHRLIGLEKNRPFSQQCGWALSWCPVINHQPLRMTSLHSKKTFRIRI